MPAGDAHDVVAYFEACRNDGVLLHLVIADPSGDRYLGEVMIVFDEHDVGEVGCLVTPGARRRGCGVEALELLVRWAFGTLGLARVQVFVAATNAAGLALAQRAGFRREGVLRDHLELDGVRVDAVVLGRLPRD
jgi:RimJ/RimL family protein N-acetyltransferase